MIRLAIFVLLCFVGLSGANPELSGAVEKAATCSENEIGAIIDGESGETSAVSLLQRAAAAKGPGAGNPNKVALTSLDSSISPRSKTASWGTEISWIGICIGIVVVGCLILMAMRAKMLVFATKEDTGPFGLLAFVMQLIIILLFFRVDYDLSDSSTLASTSVYNMYVGVALMMLVGFGYLMTFLKAYGLGAVGLTMFITCLGVEWALLIENLMRGTTVHMNFMSLLNANFAVAAVLISFGGLIGKISPTQVLLVTVIEITCYSVNKVFILTDGLNIQDCGGTIIIHVFGAYFGLACCAALGPAPEDHPLETSSYTSDLFSFVGTVFLWLFWPSFVAGGLPAGTHGYNLALMNTVLALLGSTVSTFALAPFFNEDGRHRRFAAATIQNATLAGGVAIGATANLAMGPQGALIIGSIAGLISCALFSRPIIPASYDTCGINNLHGVPGIFGGLMSVVMPFFVMNTGVIWWRQLVGLICTLLVAGCTGSLTGLLLRTIGVSQKPFNDGMFWEGVADEKFFKKISGS